MQNEIAPIDQDDHGEKALAAALEIQNFCQRSQKSNQAGNGFGETRIGIHSGPALVGNIGGTDRFNYTAIGDTINIAASLESSNKYLGTNICLTDVTLNLCRDADLRPVGDLVLKGKTKAISVFTPAFPEQDKKDYLEAFSLLGRSPSQAENLFEIILEKYPKDGLSRYHLDRIEAGQRDSLIVMEGKLYETSRQQFVLWSNFWNYHGSSTCVLGCRMGCHCLKHSDVQTGPSSGPQEHDHFR